MADVVTTPCLPLPTSNKYLSMDRKSYIVLFLSLVLFVGAQMLVNKIFPPRPIPQSTNMVATATNKLSTNALAEAAHQRTEKDTPPVLNPSVPATTPAIPTGPEQLLVFENENVRYTLTSRGGGISHIDLKKYPEVVGRNKNKTASATNVATLNTKAAYPVLATPEWDALGGTSGFILKSIPNGARAEKLLTNGVTLVKEYTLSTNYLLETTLRLENRGTAPLTLPGGDLIAGTATPLHAQDNNTTLLGTISYDGAKAQYIGDNWFANRYLGCLPGTPRSEYVSASNVVWSAVHNQFFAIAVIPKEPAFRLKSHRVDLPPPSAIELAENKRTVAHPYGYVSCLTLPGTTVNPAQAWERKFTLYTGPREYNTLARIGAQYHNDLDLVMNFSGFFGFFAKLLLLSMNGIHALHLGYGMAIIVITVIIKLLFWPLTNASTRSMKRMAALQPQMKAIQEKYKDDPRKMNMKVMEFMKQNRVNPASGCFPMLLQIPVFFGFYTMLQSAIELRGASFLWAKDLSVADTIFVIPGIDFPVNPLPLLMGVTMLWQARMTPPSPGMDPTQQKIMKYMPLMFMVFLYNFSAGLTLYWTVQNLLTIAQMKLTKTNQNDSVPAHGAGKNAPVTPGPRKLKG